MQISAYDRWLADVPDDSCETDYITHETCGHCQKKVDAWSGGYIDESYEIECDGTAGDFKCFECMESDILEMYGVSVTIKAKEAEQCQP